MRRLLDWLRGRGTDPLAPTHVPASDGPDEPEGEVALQQWARELGVEPETMQVLVEQRRALVYDVAQDPRAWGLDLLPTGAPRRDIAAELRARTRVTGALAGSFLVEYDALLELAPDPPTLPDGMPLDEHLVREARLSPEVARDLSAHVRSTMQASLGRPLDAGAIEHAVREVAWDHDLDAARVAPLVVGAMREWI